MSLVVCSMGGGFHSTGVLPRILLEKYPKGDIRFVTCVLPNEHPSMWALYDAVETTLDITVDYIAYDPASSVKYRHVTKAEREDQKRLWTPFDVFDDVHFIGNTRVDPCSRILKRETFANYMSTLVPTAHRRLIKIAIGIHSEEIERTLNIRKNWTSQGYDVIFPVLDWERPEDKTNNEILQEWYGVTLPMYDLGFEHNNCHGACVKAGQRQWALVWYYYPEVYAEWEDRMEQWNAAHDKKHAFLRKVIDGKTHHVTLREFREHYLEPAICAGKDDFLSRFIKSLPGSPPCAWCAAI